MARKRPTRLVMGPCILEIDRIVRRDVQYQFKFQGDSGQDGRTEGGENHIPQVQKFHAHGKFQGSNANSVGGDSRQDGRTAYDHIIPTFSPKSVGMKNVSD
ncbi:hypothetical protein DPMN_137619 [Dreissena polymorpha]|uniref:Uncharacterized protein n=1 Tax=Dreissena polymorpha TaxID=45954 RepID=A0A9D4G2A3_DREPO|nr:hypothetical protein DPMN_137619 [Dreissena polymorpha]